VLVTAEAVLGPLVQWPPVQPIRDKKHKIIIISALGSSEPAVKPTRRTGRVRQTGDRVQYKL